MTDKAQLLETIRARFPHISSKIETFWGRPEFSPYMDNLFRDTRGGTRQGFPKDIAAALWRLHQAHDKEFPELVVEVPDIWTESRRH